MTLNEQMNTLPLNEQVESIDDTLELRSRQIGDTAQDSYTLSLLRDSNEAGKKYGQESIEVTMAVTGEEVEDCEGEIADLIYAALVFARSRGKAAKLSNVLGILVARNEAGTVVLENDMVSYLTDRN